MGVTIAWLALSVCVAALLAALRAGSKPAEWIAKPIASTVFVVAAVVWGALDTSYGRWVLAALVCSWCGDVLLIPRSQRSFLAGLGAFLMGHVAYVGAFVTRGVSHAASLVAFALLLVPAVLVGRWLLPHVPRAMKVPVLAYMGVITTMVACAAGAVTVLGDRWLLVGAVAFYLSDLSVARDRFVAPGFDNKRWGIPLYYGAQLVLAGTVQT